MTSCHRATASGRTADLSYTHSQCLTNTQTDTLCTYVFVYGDVSLQLCLGCECVGCDCLGLSLYLAADGPEAFNAGIYLAPFVDI